MSIQTIRTFFAEKYPHAINTKSRKREIVMQRRMIVIFLFQEGKMRTSAIKNIIGGKHQIPSYFLRTITDKHFENFYRAEIEKFKDEFAELIPD